MATTEKNLSAYNVQNIPSAENMKFGIVVSEWNEAITGALRDGAVNTLIKHKVKRENIIVKDEEPIEYKIRESFHGPIINDVLLKKGTSNQPVAVYWEYLHAEQDLFEPVFTLGQTSNMVDARNAAPQIQADPRPTAISPINSPGLSAKHLL